MSFLLVIFFNLLNEHFLSPATKVKIKQSSARNTKLFTIAPISHFREDAASLAVRAVSFKTIIFKSLSKSLSTFSALHRCRGGGTGRVYGSHRSSSFSAQKISLKALLF